MTIVGCGAPSDFAISVDGQIGMIGGNPLEQVPVVSGGVAEGSIDTGVQRYRFSGQMANVQLVD